MKKVFKFLIFIVTIVGLLAVTAADVNAEESTPYNFVYGNDSLSYYDQEYSSFADPSVDIILNLYWSYLSGIRVGSTNSWAKSADPTPADVTLDDGVFVIANAFYDLNNPGLVYDLTYNLSSGDWFLSGNPPIQNNDYFWFGFEFTVPARSAEINATSQHVETYINNTISETAIRSTLTAYDEVDGDITDSITLVNSARELFIFTMISWHNRGLVDMLDFGGLPLILAAYDYDMLEMFDFEFQGQTLSRSLIEYLWINVDQPRIYNKQTSGVGEWWLPYYVLNSGELGATYEVTVEVLPPADHVKPVLYIPNGSFFTIDEINAMTTQDIIDILVQTGQLDLD